MFLKEKRWDCFRSRLWKSCNQKIFPSLAGLPAYRLEDVMQTIGSADRFGFQQLYKQFLSNWDKGSARREKIYANAFFSLSKLFRRGKSSFWKVCRPKKGIWLPLIKALNYKEKRRSGNGLQSTKWQCSSFFDRRIFSGMHKTCDRHPADCLAFPADFNGAGFPYFLYRDSAVSVPFVPVWGFLRMFRSGAALLCHRCPGGRARKGLTGSVPEKCRRKKQSEKGHAGTQESVYL